MAEVYRSGRHGPGDARKWDELSAVASLRGDRTGQLVTRLAARAGRTFRISEKTLARVTERGGRSDGVVVLAEMPVWTPGSIPLADSGLVLVTDGVEIPANLGTMDAVGADCLVVAHRKTRMSHPKVLRASQGMSIRLRSALCGPRPEILALCLGPERKCGGVHLS